MNHGENLELQRQGSGFRDDVKVAALFFDKGYIFYSKGELDSALYNLTMADSLLSHINTTPEVANQISSLNLYDIGRETLLKALRKNRPMDETQINRLFEKKSSEDYLSKLKNEKQEARGVLLNDNQMLLHFFSGGDSIYCLAKTQEASKIFGFERRALTDSIQSLNQSLTNVELIKTRPSESVKSFSKRATDLYDLLLRPIFNGMGDRPHELVIIPDGVVNTLSFETLRVNESDGEYLFESMDISYVLSQTQLFSDKANTDREKRMNFFGRSSFEGIVQGEGVTIGSKNKKFKDLVGVAQEKQGLMNLFGSSYFNDISLVATETIFDNNQSSGILHLATHSSIDHHSANSSYIVLNPEAANEDGILSVVDLFQKQSGYELVYLSACESGIGTFRQGDGNMSLAYGFLYSGSKSVVMSRWKIPDETTPELVGYFYEALKAGNKKSEALNLARRRFLDNHKNEPLLSHPYFWSGFSVIGNDNPVFVRSTAWKKILLLVLILFILLSLLIRHYWSRYSRK